jgi:hemin uptake protein HemP
MALKSPPAPNPTPLSQLLLGLQEGRVTSQDLLGVRNQLIIEHNGREYRLRVTQNGKLILTA